MRGALAAGVLALVLAGGAGYLAAAAIGQGAGEPTRTVTVDVGTGAQGPPGPQGERGPAGPPGPAGQFDCGAGYEVGVLVINAPGGQVRIKTCLAAG